MYIWISKLLKVVPILRRAAFVLFEEELNKSNRTFQGMIDSLRSDVDSLKEINDKAIEKAQKYLDAAVDTKSKIDKREETIVHLNAQLSELREENDLLEAQLKQIKGE